MQDKTTILTNPNFPEEEAKKFSFDHSYWSHDGFIEHQDSSLVTEADSQHPNGYKYASQVRFLFLPSVTNWSDEVIVLTESRYFPEQERVYNDLGRDLLKNAFDGYNCAIFAYGQTGSGKSYSIIGYGANKGTCFDIKSSASIKLLDNILSQASHASPSLGCAIFTLHTLTLYDSCSALFTPGRFLNNFHADHA